MTKIDYRTRKTVWTSDYIGFDAWCHRTKGWKYDSDLKIFSRERAYGSGKDYCLGSRIMLAEFWAVEDGEYWRGSYYFVNDNKVSDMHWHGGPSFDNVLDVIKWVRDANYKEFGCELWSSDGEENGPYHSIVKLDMEIV